MPSRKRSNGRMHRFTACVLVALYAFLATIGTSIVLCQETGGHVAIEWRGAACCEDEAALPRTLSHEPSIANVSADGSGECGECVDRPASSLLTSRSAGSTRSPSVPAPVDLPTPAADVGFSPAWLFCAALRVATHRAAPVAPPPPAMIRTPVLRC